MNDIAIVVVGYNRTDSLIRLLESLNNARYTEEIPLIISLDYSGNKDIVAMADRFEWKHGHKTVIAHTERLGLKKHILKCGDFTEQYESIIVLEDDLYISPYFMDYVKESIIKYRNDERIAGIGLYSNIIEQNSGFKFEAIDDGYDVYFMQYACSWGQVWIKDKWNEFKQWYNENSEPFNNVSSVAKNVNRWDERSWLKYHVRFCAEKKKYFVYPRISLTTNFSESGSHSKIQNNYFQTQILSGEKKWNLPMLDESRSLYDAFFENILLYKSLGLEEKDVTIDLYGGKNYNDTCQTRYLLTTKNENYEIIKSYGLMMKPRDLNIIYNIPGNEIFLYDREKEKKNRKSKSNRKKELRYYIGSINTYDLMWYSIVNTIERIKIKFKKN